MKRYEMPVSKEIVDISSLVADRLSRCSDIYAMILCGSCARGEESYYEDCGTRKLLSDYETLVVSNGLLSEKTIRRLEETREILHKMTGSPFFEFEWSVMPVSKLDHSDRRFHHFETATAGYLIYGNDDVFERFPEITPSNINRSELNSIAVHRYYHVFRDWMHVDQRKRKYLIVRNTLDIPTLVLPYLGVLLPSYKLRAEAFAHWENEGIFSEELFARQGLYLDLKTDYSSSAYEKLDEREMLVNFMADFDEALDFLREKLQGEPFLRDRRMLVAGIAHLDWKRIAKAFSKPKEERLLVERMRSLLDRGSFSLAEEEEVGDRMEKLYGYR